MTKGKALDLSHSNPLSRTDVRITGTDKYSDLKGSDVIMITAGRPRGPGMTRDDLIALNAPIMRSVAGGVKEFCPDAFVICITNPLDAMVQLLQKESGLPRSMVCGMAGVLDSTRLRCLIAERVGVSVEDVQATVMGGHADSMVPLINSISVGGLRVPEMVKMGWITDSDIQEIVTRTACAGGEVVKLLKTSAYFAPAASAVSMAEAFLFDKKRVLACSAPLDGQYGVHDLCVGVPVIVGSGGIEKVLEYELTESEKVAFEKSVEGVRSSTAAIPSA